MTVTLLEANREIDKMARELKRDIITHKGKDYFNRFYLSNNNSSNDVVCDVHGPIMTWMEQGELIHNS